MRTKTIRHQPFFPTLRFGDRIIGFGHPVFIIAEIGINHEGRLAECVAMIDRAAAAGADAVKLQLVNADESYVPGTASYETFKRAELAEKEIETVFQHARQTGIDIFCTCGDFTSFETIERFDPPAYKVSSGLLTHIPLIERLAASGKALLMSTGMADVSLIQTAVDTATSAGAKNLGLFQCTSLYPAPPAALHLYAISYLEKRFNLSTGFSDHSKGTHAAPIAVAAGARMIEKHFSLDPGRRGFDHHISLDPGRFTEMVQAVRQVEKMMGIFDKIPVSAEKTCSNALHRCIVAKRDIRFNQVLTDNDIGVMRVNAVDFGLPPAEFSRTLGKRTKRAVKRFTPINDEDLE